MLDLYDSGRWEWALNLIDHLPRTSATVQAMAEDEDLAEELGDMPAGAKSTALSEWSSEVELLAAMFDRLGDVINAVLISGDRKPQKFPEWPAPVVASQKVQARRRREVAEDMAAKLWPDGGA